MGGFVSNFFRGEYKMVFLKSRTKNHHCLFSKSANNGTILFEFCSVSFYGQLGSKKREKVGDEELRRKRSNGTGTVRGRGRCSEEAGGGRESPEGAPWWAPSRDGLSSPCFAPS